MNELGVNEDQVREERLRSVHHRAHWFFLAAVLGGSVVLMLGLIAVPDAAT